jgi:hypothetical protein
MLYMDTTTFNVYRDYKNLKGNYESFTNSLDIHEGYVVAVEYSTYDSFGPGSGHSYEVLDLYRTREDAKDAMRAVLADTKKGIPILDAIGNPIKHVFWHGWGTSLEGVVMNKVVVDDEPNFIRVETWQTI